MQQGSCGHGKPGKVMEFEWLISRPGEVMEIFKNVEVMENGNKLYHKKLHSNQMQNVIFPVIF